MNITKGKLKQIIKNTIKEEYTEREVTQDFTNPDEVRAVRRGWYDRGVLDGKNALESDTNQFGEQYSESYGGWNAKHGKPPVEYLDGYNDGSGGKAEEHYEEKVLQNRDDMLAQKAEMKEGTAKMNITKGRLKQIIQEELSRASAEKEVPVEEGLFDKVKQTVGKGETNDYNDYKWDLIMGGLIADYFRDGMTGMNDERSKEAIRKKALEAKEAGADSVGLTTSILSRIKSLLKMVTEELEDLGDDPDHIARTFGFDESFFDDQSV